MCSVRKANFIFLSFIPFFVTSNHFFFFNQFLVIQVCSNYRNKHNKAKVQSPKFWLSNPPKCTSHDNIAVSLFCLLIHVYLTHVHTSDSQINTQKLRLITAYQYAKWGAFCYCSMAQKLFYFPFFFNCRENMQFEKQVWFSWLQSLNFYNSFRSTREMWKVFHKNLLSFALYLCDI